MSQLRRLREPMLREARLLDSLDHECVVHLECGWLEQRIGETPRWLGDSFLDRHDATVVNNFPEKRTGEGDGGFAEETSRWLQSAEQLAPNSTATNTRTRCCSRFLVSSRPLTFDEDPVAALRSCVPWTVGEQVSDSDSSDNEEGKEGFPISRKRENDEAASLGR